MSSIMPLRYILILFVAVGFTSCGEASLQKYFVEKQDDPKFMKLDLAPSLLEGKNQNVEAEEKEALKGIKKINVVAFPIKEDNKERFELERKEVELILEQEQYVELTRVKSSNWSFTVNYTGAETAIDEVIVDVVNNEQGFAVFRMIGDDLRPEQIVQFVLTAKDGGIDFSAFEGLQNIFEE